ncbi:MAG: hypothetical protein JEZ09_21425 [Salinivirgaceae bacterium]|nr:hypothetical protein [Salinivirgaceae bacterium]
MEIMKLVHKICELIDDDDKMLSSIKGQMFADAAMLSVKVAGAESG